MKLYHGTTYSSATDIVMNGVDLSKSQPYLDFGAGFYTTPSYDHAAKTAIRKTDKFNKRYNKNEEPYIVEIACNFNKNKRKLNIKQFPTHTNEWAQFVVNNRLRDDILKKYGIRNSNRDLKYDIVYGEIADGNIINIAFRVNNEIMLSSDVLYEDLLKKGELYGYQYSFHTELAISCIESIKCDIIKNKEKYFYSVFPKRKKV